MHLGLHIVETVLTGASRSQKPRHPNTQVVLACSVLEHIYCARCLPKGQQRTAWEPGQSALSVHSCHTHSTFVTAIHLWVHTWVHTYIVSHTRQGCHWALYLPSPDGPGDKASIPLRQPWRNDGLAYVHETGREACELFAQQRQGVQLWGIEMNTKCIWCASWLSCEFSAITL